MGGVLGPTFGLANHALGAQDQQFAENFYILPPGAHPGLPKGEGPPRGNSAHFFFEFRV